MDPWPATLEGSQCQDARFEVLKHRSACVSPAGVSAVSVAVGGLGWGGSRRLWETDPALIWIWTGSKRGF